MNNNKNYKTVKFKDDELELDVNVSTMDDTVWLTVEQIARLFERDRSVIIKHIKNILFDKELDNSTCAFFAQVQIEGSREITRKVEYYNLDMIISVGYRVKSKRGIIFRKWATNVLKEFLLKGYAINENRLVVSNENYIELRNEVVSINDRLLKSL